MQHKQVSTTYTHALQYTLVVVEVCHIHVVCHTHTYMLACLQVRRPRHASEPSLRSRTCIATQVSEHYTHALQYTLVVVEVCHTHVVCHTHTHTHTYMLACKLGGRSVNQTRERAVTSRTCIATQVSEHYTHTHIYITLHSCIVMLVVCHTHAYACKLGGRFGNQNTQVTSRACVATNISEHYTHAHMYCTTHKWC